MTPRWWALSRGDIDTTLVQVGFNLAQMVIPVFLLLPVVLGVGWHFTRMGLKHGEARVPVPVFAIVFLVLCALNSALPLMPALVPTYAPIKSALVETSNWGLLLAIGALGLGTSIKTIIGLGWRHVTTVLGTTAIIFVMVTGGLLLMRSV